MGLAVMALATAAIMAFRPTPSPVLKLNDLASVLMESAAATRHQAVTNERQTSWQEEVRDCQFQPVTVTFYADGSADPAEICITEDDRTLRLTMDAWSGRLSIVRE